MRKSNFTQFNHILNFFYLKGAKNDSVYFNCYDYFKNGFKTDGLYNLNIFNSTNKTEVYCDMTRGGWIRIMNRVDLTTDDFDKTMEEYRKGFGDINGNHWLGLRNMRALVKYNKMKLRVEFYNNHTDDYMCEYESFYLYPEYEDFRIYLGNKVYGDIGYDNSHIEEINGMKFSAKDHDNDDIFYYNCAKIHKGGFWFGGNCFYMCPTCGSNVDGQLNIGDYRRFFKYIKMYLKPA